MRKHDSPGKFNPVQNKQIELLLPEGFEQLLREIHDKIIHENIANDTKSLALWLKDFFIFKNGGIRYVVSKEFESQIIDTESEVPLNPGKVEQLIPEKIDIQLGTKKISTETETTQSLAILCNSAKTDFQILEQKLTTTLTDYKTLQEELRIKQESTELTKKLIENHKIELLNAYSELENIQELTSTVYNLTIEKILEKQSPEFITHYNSKLEQLEAEFENKLKQEIESMIGSNEKALQRVGLFTRTINFLEFWSLEIN